MARSSPKPTSFMNVKRRVIYTTASGKYIVKTEKGVKYAPKAKFYKNPAGSTVNVKYAHANVAIPSPIRPKMVRKVRKYAARVPGVRVHHVKRPVGRPRKYIVTPGRNMGIAGLFGNKPIRKLRKNSGMKRGPRVPKAMLGANPFAKLM